MHFEWDDAKNAANINKHGIDFADVTDVFNHPMLVMLDDRGGLLRRGTLNSDWLDTGPDRSGGLHRAKGRCDPHYLRPKSDQTRGTPL